MNVTHFSFLYPHQYFNSYCFRNCWDFWNNGFWGWPGWTAISAIFAALSAIVLAVTIYFIYKQTSSIKDQSEATKDLIKFTVMPKAYFILRSARTLYNYEVMKRLGGLQDVDLPDTQKKEWLKDGNFIIPNRLIIKNISNFPINFYVKITFNNNNHTVTNTSHWEEPLYIFPDGMVYPEAFALDKQLFSDIENPIDKKIVACFEYTYSPVFADELRAKVMQQKWIFDLEKYEWTGPDGVRDIFLT